MTEKGQHLDLSSGLDSPSAGAESGPNARSQFLGVHFECCEIYARVYPNKTLTAYLGHCPRCARQIKILIGEGGTDSRFFKVR